MSDKSLLCIIGYVAASTMVLWMLDDRSGFAQFLQIAGAWVLGMYCGHRDHVEGHP